MLQQGAGTLSDAELLAILLRTGRPGTPAVGLAEGVLRRVGGLGGLLSVFSAELITVPGLGPAKAAQLLAAVELARRLARLRGARRPRLAGPDDVASLLQLELAGESQEHFFAILLNTQHEVLHVHRVSTGLLNQTPAHPREVFRAAIRLGSAAVILAHNHPSGDPRPSPQDVELTRRLAQAGEVLGIEVLDHVIVGDARHASLREMGYLPVTSSGPAVR